MNIYEYIFIYIYEYIFIYIYEYIFINMIPHTKSQYCHAQTQSARIITISPFILYYTGRQT